MSDRTPSAARDHHGALSGPEPGEAQGEAAASRSCQGSLDGTAPAPGPESASAAQGHEIEGEVPSSWYVELKIERDRYREALERISREHPDLTLYIDGVLNG